MKVHGQDYEVEVRVSESFRACHSLPMRPELHWHDWEVEFAVSGPLNSGTGMVCDMLELHQFFSPFVKELDNRDLHKCDVFQAENDLVSLTATYPTCDTLAHYFLWKAIPIFRENPRFQDLRISQIRVAISEPDGDEPWGHALIRPKSK